jgi:hypothetical protein
VSGDPETAQFFYQKTREAQGPAAKVGLATGLSAEGMREDYPAFRDAACRGVFYSRA